MSLSKRKIIDRIEITEEGHIQIREAIVIEEDGQEISRNNHRYVLAPGDDVSAHDDKIKSITYIIWTPEIVQTYLNKAGK